MESLQVSDYMNTHPVKLNVDMPVAQAVEVLLASGQSGGPVPESLSANLHWLTVC